jgi:hypothetical protein
LPGGGAEPAPQSGSRRDAEVDAAAERDRPAPGGGGGAGPSGTTGRRTDNRGTGDRGPDDLDRSCRSAGGLRALLRSGDCLWQLAVSELSAVLLSSAGRLPARYWPGHRPSLWRRCRHRRLALGLGQPQLGRRQRQHQRQSIQQHQSHGGRRQHLAAQRGASSGCCLSGWGDPSALWARDGRRRRPPGLPRL